MPCFVSLLFFFALLMLGETSSKGLLAPVKLAAWTPPGPGLSAPRFSAGVSSSAPPPPRVGTVACPSFALRGLEPTLSALTLAVPSCLAFVCLGRRRRGRGRVVVVVVVAFSWFGA